MTHRVQLGIEVLLEDHREELAHRSIGLCCNPTSVNHDFRHIIDIFNDEPNINLKVLFGPEHGIRSEAQDMIGVDDNVDSLTGLPVYSLYGSDESSLKPTPEMLKEVDLLIFDIQDIGSRYYTYIYTMSYLMEAAAEQGIELWVLDRPNPISGHLVEGPKIEEGYFSFVGRFPIAVRHGMTAGELALLFNDIFNINCQLKVIPMKGWKRHLWLDQTDVPWILPSPNMPTLDTATVYPGGCLFEGTNLSEARGTTKPFEFVGAPYLDPFQMAKQLNALTLPGVHFRPIHFSPTFHKWKFESCGGVQIHVLDRESFKPFLTGIAVLKVAYELGGENFQWREEVYEFVGDRLAIDLLLGHPHLRKAIERGDSLEKIEQSWQTEFEEFLHLRQNYLLY